eukprot:Protomagalhaensia_sp_Gyna_25__5438@NODE_710_length_2798_cov_491_571584_g552_i0_p2_GENE_NODE_710_length_2798_cov_491_571584_g552_i0NODE_710_length_2798_cov_491_571584_g552_i0_p2_ORF_typecomplete_len112_score4_32_NODE_710_length_2798_cov_491_571584_g552_i016141949
MNYISEDLNLVSFTLVLRQLINLQINALANPIPSSMNARHLYRLRVMRALAPLICRLNRQQFNGASGECEPLSPFMGGLSDSDFGPSPMQSEMRPLSPFVVLGPPAPLQLY